MQSQEPTWPGESLVAVTPSDTNVTNVYRQLYVGTGGTITVTTLDDVDIPYVNVPSGVHIGPFFIKKVKATGTTASNIVGYI